MKQENEMIMISPTGNAALNMTIKSSESLSKITTMLFEQMEKVRGNPAEIPVADSMCMIAGRIIDTAKGQIAATELMLKATGKI
jgi:hypothetical protein